MELINKYFPELSIIQSKRLSKLFELYTFCNEIINVISRKDMHNFYLKHVLHCLAISKIILFKKGAKVLDIGSGGGFPAIPLAIIHEDVSFFLSDSINKKTRVMAEVINALELKNAFVFNERAENIDFEYNYVCCRAVASLSKLHDWVNSSRKRGGGSKRLNYYFLKGGDLDEEIKEFRQKLNRPVNLKKINIPDIFNEPIFENKYIISIEDV